MGSFDEAIRQHLDLKRKRGADPHEVAHLEREALGPSEPPEIGSEPESFRAWSTTQAHRPYDLEATAEKPARQKRPRTVDEETEEIDMAAVLAANEPDSAPEIRAARAYDWSADLQSPDIVDPLSSFEWEIPARGQLSKAA